MDGVDDRREVQEMRTIYTINTDDLVHIIAVLQTADKEKQFLPYDLRAKLRRLINKLDKALGDRERGYNVDIKVRL